MSSKRLPKVLYKYRGYDTRTLRMLERPELYYADPASFNDPFDCQATVGKTKSISRARELLTELVDSNNPKKTDAGQKRIEDIDYQSTDDSGFYSRKTNLTDRKLSLYINEIDIEVSKSFHNTGVLSLCASWDNVLMWSHYGDLHNGICIGYSTKNNLCDSLRPVIYTDRRELSFQDVWKWRMNNDSMSEKSVSDHFFYSKAKNWSYEKEWRDLRRPPDSKQSGVGLAPYTPFEISEIVFGLHCDNSIIASISKLFGQEWKGIKFYKVHTVGDSFNIRRTRVDISEYIELSPGHSGVSLLKGFQRIKEKSSSE